MIVGAGLWPHYRLRRVDVASTQQFLVLRITPEAEVSNRREKTDYYRRVLDSIRGVTAIDLCGGHDLPMALSSRLTRPTGRTRALKESRSSIRMAQRDISDAGTALSEDASSPIAMTPTAPVW